MGLRSHFFVLVLAAGLLGGCRGLSREIQQSLPEFMRADPGTEEMEIFAKVRKVRDYTPEDEANQLRTLQTAREEYLGGQHDEAVTRIEEYLEQYPASRHDEDARFLMALALYHGGEPLAAYLTLKDFSALYPVSDRSRQAMEIEYSVGKDYLAGKHSTFFGLFSQESRGEDILNHVVETYPSGRRAPDAQWLLARYQMNEGAWPEAHAAFQFLAEQYKTSEWFAPSLFYAAYAKYRQIKGSVYDPVTMADARRGFETYLRDVPNGAWVAEAREIATEIEEIEAQHLLGVGNWYLDQGKPYTARYYFMNVMARFPSSTAAEEARATLPKAQASVPSAEKPAEPESSSQDAAKKPSGKGG